MRSGIIALLSLVVAYAGWPARALERADAWLQAAALIEERFYLKAEAAALPEARTERLAAADGMAALGAWYARHDTPRAAAALLAAAHAVQRDLLGAEHSTTIHTALLLGRAYAELERLDDAEMFYREAFHARERVRGSNRPDLSLYLRLLADVYERQGRATEAQALNEHVRRLLDARQIDGAPDTHGALDRPVSPQFPLASAAPPVDLVRAADYGVPLSKPATSEEMRLRLAADTGAGADPAVDNLPARLARLISLCASQSGQEITLRSGHRPHAMQQALHAAYAAKGTVAPAGMSEHQTGLAADIDVDGRFMRPDDPAHECFEQHAFLFGFILSYPPGNSYLDAEDGYEPWHWRYVGLETARLYREAGPMNRPLEFLAALPCYEARAREGLFTTAKEKDVCLLTDVRASMEQQTDNTHWSGCGWRRSIPLGALQK